MKKKGQIQPEGDGVLIFDEVKVIARLLWNSRSQQMVGLAMTHEDMSCLHDVYQALDPDALTKSTTYMHARIFMERFNFFIRRCRPLL